MRYTLRITGESGQGINSIGEILTKALKNSGYYTFGYREYPSLIKGGIAMYQLEISDEPVNSTTTYADLMFSLSRYSMHHYARTLKPGSHIFHTFSRNMWPKEVSADIKSIEPKVYELNAEEQTILAGGTKLMVNVYIMGYIWDLLGQELEKLTEQVMIHYAKKTELMEANISVLNSGYSTEKETGRYQLTPSSESTDKYAVMTGNQSVALGAYSAGCRAFYAYPMTPASSVLTTLAEMSHETGMLIKQAEDEITAAQMMLGSMYVGTRAMTGTSGGGFDLMTESLSLAGMAEIPAVFLLAQRPGPATGLPTWTSASDLDLAIYSGHGEFPRVVLTLSDTKDSFHLTRKAFDIAEKYQLPVIILTDKHLAESLYLTDELHADSEIERGLEVDVPENSYRYVFTKDGISPRWLPGTSEQVYVTNSDEHTMDGSSTEDMEVAKAMYDKRLLKIEAVLDALPEPIFTGDGSSKYLVISYGSPVTVVREVIDKINKKNGNRDIALLQYEYLYPLRTEKLHEICKSGVKVIFVEQNATGQFERLVHTKLNTEPNFEILDSFRKYDGKPIFFDEMYNFLSKYR